MMISEGCIETLFIGRSVTTIPAVTSSVEANVWTPEFISMMHSLPDSQSLKLDAIVEFSLTTPSYAPPMK